MYRMWAAQLGMSKLVWGRAFPEDAHWGLNTMLESRIIAMMQLCSQAIASLALQGQDCPQVVADLSNTA